MAHSKVSTRNLFDPLQKAIDTWKDNQSSKSSNISTPLISELTLLNSNMINSTKLTCFQDEKALKTLCFVLSKLNQLVNSPADSIVALNFANCILDQFDIVIGGENVSKNCNVLVCRGYCYLLQSVTSFMNMYVKLQPQSTEGTCGLTPLNTICTSIATCLDKLMMINDMKKSNILVCYNSLNSIHDFIKLNEFVWDSLTRVLTMPLSNPISDEIQHMKVLQWIASCINCLEGTILREPTLFASESKVSKGFSSNSMKIVGATLTSLVEYIKNLRTSTVQEYRVECYEAMHKLADLLGSCASSKLIEYARRCILTLARCDLEQLEHKLPVSEYASDIKCDSLKDCSPGSTLSVYNVGNLLYRIATQHVHMCESTDIQSNEYKCHMQREMERCCNQTMEMIRNRIAYQAQNKFNALCSYQIQGSEIVGGGIYLANTVENLLALCHSVFHPGVSSCFENIDLLSILKSVGSILLKLDISIGSELSTEAHLFIRDLCMKTYRSLVNRLHDCICMVRTHPLISAPGFDGIASYQVVNVYISLVAGLSSKCVKAVGISDIQLPSKEHSVDLSSTDGLLRQQVMFGHAQSACLVSYGIYLVEYLRKTDGIVLDSASRNALDVTAARLTQALQGNMGVFFRNWSSGSDISLLLNAQVTTALRMIFSGDIPVAVVTPDAVINRLNMIEFVGATVYHSDKVLKELRILCKPSNTAGSPENALMDVYFSSIQQVFHWDDSIVMDALCKTAVAVYASKCSHARCTLLHNRIEECDLSKPLLELEAVMGSFQSSFKPRKASASKSKGVSKESTMLESIVNFCCKHILGIERLKWKSWITNWMLQSEASDDSKEPDYDCNVEKCKPCHMEIECDLRNIVDELVLLVNLLRGVDKLSTELGLLVCHFVFNYSGTGNNKGVYNGVCSGAMYILSLCSQLGLVELQYQFVRSLENISCLCNGAANSSIPAFLSQSKMAIAVQGVCCNVTLDAKNSVCQLEEDAMVVDALRIVKNSRQLLDDYRKICDEMVDILDREKKLSDLKTDKLQEKYAQVLEYRDLSKPAQLDAKCCEVKNDICKLISLFPEVDTTTAIQEPISCFQHVTVVWLHVLYIKLALFVSGHHFDALKWCKKALTLILKQEDALVSDLQSRISSKWDNSDGVLSSASFFSANLFVNHQDCILSNYSTIKMELLLLIGSIHEQTGNLPHCMSYLVEASGMICITKNKRHVKGLIESIVENTKLFALYTSRVWYRINSSDRMNTAYSVLTKLCNSFSQRIYKYCGIDDTKGLLDSPSDSCVSALPVHVDFMWDSVGRNVQSLVGDNETFESLCVFDTCVSVDVRLELLVEFLRSMLLSRLLSNHLADSKNSLHHRLTFNGICGIQESPLTTVNSNDAQGIVPRTRAFDVLRYLRRRNAANNLCTEKLDATSAFLFASASCYTSFECHIDSTDTPSQLGLLESVLSGSAPVSEAVDVLMKRLGGEMNCCTDKTADGTILCSIITDKASNRLLISRMLCQNHVSDCPRVMMVGIPLTASFFSLLDQWKVVMEENRKQLELTRDIEVVTKWTETEKEEWWKLRYETDETIHNLLMGLEEYLGIWTCLFNCSGEDSENDADMYISKLHGAQLTCLNDFVAETEYAAKNPGSPLQSVVSYVLPWMHLLMEGCAGGNDEKRKGGVGAVDIFSLSSNSGRVTHAIADLLLQWKSGGVNILQSKQIDASAYDRAMDAAEAMMEMYGAVREDVSTVNSAPAVDLDLSVGIPPVAEASVVDSPMAMDASGIGIHMNCNTSSPLGSDDDEEDALSRMIQTVSIEEKAETHEVAPDIAIKGVDYSSMKVAELKDHCKKNNLATTGKKSDLIDRLTGLGLNDTSRGTSKGVRMKGVFLNASSPPQSSASNQKSMSATFASMNLGCISGSVPQTGGKGLSLPQPMPCTPMRSIMKPPCSGLKLPPAPTFPTTMKTPSRPKAPSTAGGMKFSTSKAKSTMKTPGKTGGALMKIFQEFGDDDEDVQLDKPTTAKKSKTIQKSALKGAKSTNKKSSSVAMTMFRDDDDGGMKSSKTDIKATSSILSVYRSDNTCSLPPHVKNTKQGGNLHRAQPHIVFILDETLQDIPLESIPCLRRYHRSCSRMPGMNALLLSCMHEPMCSKMDNQIASKSKNCETNNNRADIEKENHHADHSVHLENSWYVIDPEKNLSGTRQVMSSLLLPFAKYYNWDGYVGEIPPEATVRRNHENSELFIYCGHGWGSCLMNQSQAVATNTSSNTSLRKFESCPAALLWGCSSGTLITHGKIHDPTGVAVTYLQRGAPFVIANLWDVTERDIDKLSETYMNKMLSGEEIVQNNSKGTDSNHNRTVEQSASCKKPALELVTPSTKVRCQSKVRTTEIKLVQPSNVLQNHKISPQELGVLLATSRDVCKLKRAVGCASVMYGIPVSVQQ